MSILFFDTETTGLPDFRLPDDHEHQPHCVQLAAVLTDDAGKEQAQINVIIKPDGWEIPAQAAEVHGITTEHAQRYGVRNVVAAGMLHDLAACAEIAVAHNIKFDAQIVRTMFARAGRPQWQIPSRKFCTAEAATPVLNLPPTERMIAAGFDKPKMPKLEECIAHFYGETLEGAHDALVDVRACARVYFELLALSDAA